MKALLQSIASLQPTSIPNISSMSCLYTAIFKNEYIHGLLLHVGFFGNMGFREKHHHCREHEARPKGHPKELKSVSDSEERSAMHVYNTKEKTMLVFYIDRKESGKKNVTILSTMHDNVKITKDQQKKPSVQAKYDHTKGSVDVVDLFLTTQPTRVKSRR